MEDAIVRREEAARILGVKPNTLAVWSSTKRYDLAYIKVGRCVRYRLVDLQAFVEANRHGYSSEEAA